MAFLTMWYETQLPEEVVDILVKDISDVDQFAEESRLHGDDVDKVIRDSNNVWVPTSHWIGGFVWHYIQRVNRENFRYDLTGIDGENMQYTHYGPGQFYDWHIDAGMDIFYKPQIVNGSGMNCAEDNINIAGEVVRKLSFTLQLSDASEYTGGEVQFLDNARNTFFAPKTRGTLILFDSRTPHRVRKVKSGLRKSLVGWAVGPRWK